MSDFIHRTTVAVLAGVTVYGMVVTVSLARQRMVLAKERKQEKAKAELESLSNGK
ncbi:hypothetical protein BDF22DRAFT_742378 [Syncephalis plumigaleata]|nr:hypothetical protein BDF22DRAFT_742378 [Syncephalis plumigaleata]